MAARWKSAAVLASVNQRFQKLSKIINAAVPEFCFYGSVKVKNEKHSLLPACQSGGLDGLIGARNQNGVDL
jgi:hypothetical protein